MDRLLLECGGLDCCLFAEDGGGSGRVKGEVALALGSALKRYRGLLRLMFLIRIDPLLRGRWLPRLVNASWLVFFFNVQRMNRLHVFFFSGDGQ
jgi:hypothetical protein